ncbi:MAG: hypothetical protein K1X72_20715 [Pyrinomonadaceae bacterium]|nr:hypothetical protein [Pyrinomonadaceae bacterium]
MWFLTVQTVPKNDSPQANNFSSATVHCWVNFPDLEAAIQLVNFYLDRKGWFVVTVEFSHRVNPQNYDKDDEGYQYALEAEKNGSSFLFQTNLAQ